MTDLAHLNQLFAASEDPWHTRAGWYYERKRDILLATLPDARYASTFEPGCGDGELTMSLASRSDHVLAMEARRDSVTAASNRTAHLSNVTITQGRLPTGWPRNQQFDLIVLNEIGLSFDPAEWASVANAVKEGLRPGGTVIACHWKHELRPNPTESAGSTRSADRSSADRRGTEDSGSQRLAAETLHGLLNSILGLPRQTKIADCDFILDAWTTRDRTVAQREGLI
ncbi:MAG: hypothetical protein QOK10_1823 [Pseudonocardiales bacterium]|jgi:hypothetical protein|nr:hypothetical protein [Pseudonocardiales bacterium]